MKKRHIILFMIVVMSVAVRATNSLPQVVEMRSTSVMNDSRYRQTNYKVDVRDVGSTIQYGNYSGVRLFNATSLQVTSGSTMQSYGGLYTEPSYSTNYSSRVAMVDTYGPQVSLSGGQYIINNKSTIASSVQTNTLGRLNAPGKGEVIARWQAWWSEFLTTGKAHTEHNLSDWWYEKYLGSAGPDEFADFLNWCRQNNLLNDEPDAPLADGTIFLLLLSLVVVLYIRHKNLKTNMKKCISLVMLLIVLFNVKAQAVNYSITSNNVPVDTYTAYNFTHLSSIFASDINGQLLSEPLMDMLILLDKDENDNPRCLLFFKKDDAYINADGNSNFPTNFNPSTRALPISLSTLSTIESTLGTSFSESPKIYVSGTCDGAAAVIDGSNAFSSEGFIEFSGGTGESIELYMEDVNLECKEKKWDINDIGTLSISQDIQVAIQTISKRRAGIGDLLASMMSPQVLAMLANIPGMSCPIVLCSNSYNNNTPPTINFHIKGDNVITGGNANFDMLDMGFIQMVSSPIAIRSQFREIQYIEETAGMLSFDDIWPTDNVGNTKRVNGKLDLPILPTNNGERATPSIDLGYPNGRCQFDGGQYVFQTTANSNMFFVSSMAVCYKRFTFMAQRCFGVGSSVSTTETGLDWTTYIKSGTFTTHSAEEYSDKIDVVARGWYNDYSDLRFPLRTQVDANATFNNCHLYLCDAAAEVGIEPTRNENGQTVQLCRKRTKIDENDIDKTTDLYLNSMMPVLEDGEYYIYPYVNADQCTDKPTVDRQYVHNWVTVIPKMGLTAQQSDGTYKDVLVMGGDIKVEPRTADETHDQTNSFLFYAQLNEYTKNYANVKLGPLDVTVQMAIEQAADENGEHEFSEVTNEMTYKIEHGLYTMLSFHSNQWYTLTVPYDVHNIYVMETNGAWDGTGSQRQFLNDQGYEDGALAQTIITSLCPDILSGKGSGVNLDLIEIATMQLGMKLNGDNNGKGIYTLKHYNPLLDTEEYSGYSAEEAHYFLYEQTNTDPLQSNGYWNVTNDRDISKFWQYAPLITPTRPEPYVNRKGEIIKKNLLDEDVKIIMQKGKIYSMYLPDEHGRDYWEGKYLVFEGYGPQEIDGKETHDNYVGKSDIESEEDNYTIDGIDFEGIKSELENPNLAPATRQWYENMLSLYEEGLTDAKYLAYMGNATFGNYTLVTTEWLWQPTWENGILTFNDEQREEYHPFDTWVVANPETMILAKRNMTTPAKQPQLGESASDIDHLPHITDIGIRVWQENGISIISYTTTDVEVYSIDGRVIWSGNMYDGSYKHISTPSGVYIIKTNNHTFKLLTQ